jgi:hypothetical protein
MIAGLFIWVQSGFLLFASSSIHSFLFVELSYTLSQYVDDFSDASPSDVSAVPQS